MNTSKKQDFADLWAGITRPRGAGEDQAVRTLCYIQNASGPVLTLVTSQPVDIAELLASMTAVKASAST